MKLRTKRRLGAWQALGLIAAIGVLISGVTFAALRSQNNLINGNTMSSASANLQMSPQNDGTWYESMSGYQFYDLLPGGEPGPKTGNNLYLKNAGSTNLELRMALNPARIYNPSQVQLQKTRLVLLDQNGTKVANPTLAELWDAHAQQTNVPLNITLPAFSTKQFVIRMQLENGAVANNSTQAVIENIDLILSGNVQGS